MATALEFRASLTKRRGGSGSALAAVLLLLSACGGGGGDSEAPPAGNTLQGVISAASPVAGGCGATGTLYRNAEVEPFVALLPGATPRLLAAWQQDRYGDGGAAALVTALSEDAGASWQRTLQPLSRCGGATAGSAGDTQRVSDPWVDFAPDGSAHLLGLSFSGGALAAGSSSALVARRSADGGRSWGTPVQLASDGAAFFNDKGALTADATDARYVYAVWDRLDSSGRGPTMLARSTDGGLSWEAARAIYTPASAGISQTIGNRIVVLPAGAERGVLVNVFTQIDTVLGTSTTRLGVIRSSDHGATWGAPVFVAELRAVGTRDPTTGHAVRDGATLPTVAVGPDNTLWLAWQDARFSGGQRDAIAVSRSADGGRSWSEPVAVNTRPDAAAFVPTLHVRADGLVGLLHYDLRNDTADPNALWADAWLLSSRDGSSWAETHIAGPFNLASAPDAGGWFLGDYMGLASSGETFFTVLVVATGDAANRTEVLAPSLRVAAVPQSAAGAQRLHAARTLAGEVGEGGTAAAETPAFRAARHAAIVRTMEARLPGWAARAGARTVPPAAP